VIRRWIGRRLLGKRNFSGNLFDRLRGLDFLLEQCADCTIMDIGCNEGLVAYEFARNGAKLVHGFDRDGQRVRFARRLFRDVPIESRFVRTNLAVSGAEFQAKHRSVLLPEYDIVLFLGVYHHLKRQMPVHRLHGLVEELLNRSGHWFVDRGKCIDEYESRIRSKGFELAHSSPAIKGHGGLLQVYRRTHPD
jgi:2-polyprenyl-3-methyl-5-hydroxy-6-metoxy-1,4-benzoquinol methylase